MPDIIERAAARLLSQIEQGAEALAAAPDHFVEDQEHRAHRLAALAGARAYAALLRDRLEGGSLSDFDLAKADLVGVTALNCGWISASTTYGREESCQRLVAAGFLVFCEADPGRFVACYRLRSPQG